MEYISEEQLTLSVTRAGILYAHISLPRGEDIIEDELVSFAVDAFDGHDDLPVSAVLRLKVVEFQFALVLLVAATINCVILQIELLMKGYDQCLEILPYLKSCKLHFRIHSREPPAHIFARHSATSSRPSTSHRFRPENAQKTVKAPSLRIVKMLLPLTTSLKFQKGLLTHDMERSRSHEGANFERYI